MTQQVKYASTRRYRDVIIQEESFLLTKNQIKTGRLVKKPTRIIDHIKNFFRRA